MDESTLDDIMVESTLDAVMDESTLDDAMGVMRSVTLSVAATVLSSSFSTPPFSRGGVGKLAG
jgi:hypothetical protein